MKLLFTACTGCGAPSASPFGVCPDCESRQVEARVAAKRRIREQQVARPKRAA
jgi:uncharacterized OB-fold protein